MTKIVGRVIKIKTKKPIANWITLWAKNNAIKRYASTKRIVIFNKDIADLKNMFI